MLTGQTMWLVRKMLLGVELQEPIDEGATLGEIRNSVLTERFQFLDMEFCSRGSGIPWEDYHESQARRGDAK